MNETQRNEKLNDVFKIINDELLLSYALTLNTAYPGTMGGSDAVLNLISFCLK